MQDQKPSVIKTPYGVFFIMELVFIQIDFLSIADGLNASP
jgi:hypothetical protein